MGELEGTRCCNPRFLLSGVLLNLIFTIGSAGGAGNTVSGVWGGRECAVVRENTGRLQKDAGAEAMGYRSQEKIGSWSPDLAGHPAGNPLTCVVGVQSPGLRLKGTVRDSCSCGRGSMHV